MSQKSQQHLSLVRNSFGQLIHTDAAGKAHVVVPVRAFAITCPTENIGLVNSEGEEVAWVRHLDDLAEGPRTLLEEEIANREFMPVIQRIRKVSSFATPSTWDVDTDRGPTQLVLKGEEDIRRLAPPALLIADTHGIHYLIRDRGALDAPSRKILDRFL